MPGAHGEWVRHHGLLLFMRVLIAHRALLHKVFDFPLHVGPVECHKPACSLVQSTQKPYLSKSKDTLLENDLGKVKVIY